MSYFLALECSLPLAEVSLFKKTREALKLLAVSRWTHSAFKSSHSDRLPWEINRLFEKTGVRLEDLNAIAVGAGPGRFTGVRTAITTAKALAFGLKIPIYPVNSLKVLAEEFYGKTEILVVSLQAFKNQVYFGEFCSQKEQISVLKFEQWQKNVENLYQNFKQKIICISDLEEFYHLSPQLKKKILFKQPKLSTSYLVRIVLREKISAQNWLNLKACYLRSAF